MNEKNVKKLADLVFLIAKKQENQQCLLLAIQEILAEQGIPRSVLDEKVQEHKLRRQAGMENLVGSDMAAQMFNEGGQSAPPPPEADRNRGGFRPWWSTLWRRR
jgi:hypothetical protein